MLCILWHTAIVNKEHACILTAAISSICDLHVVDGIVASQVHHPPGELVLIGTGAGVA